jgi:hypothetical protein
VNFNRKEIDSCESLPVGAYEIIPRRLLSDFWVWVKATPREHSADRSPAHVVSKMFHLAFNSEIAPRGILGCNPYNHVRNCTGDGRTPRLTAMLTSIIFLGDEFLVPSEDRVRGENAAYVTQELAAQFLAFDRKAAALIIIQNNSLLAELLPKNLVLFLEIFYHLLLLTVYPAR